MNLIRRCVMIETLDAVYNNLDKDGIPKPAEMPKEGKGEEEVPDENN